MKFDLWSNPEASLAYPFIEREEHPWDVLSHIPEIIRELAKNLNPEEFECLEGEIYIAKDAKLAKNISITGPCIIGSGTEVRPGAFIRGNAIIGRGCVVGNSTEIKNAIIFDSVQIPHFNYIGDSVLGYKSHMGAGAVTSNVKSDKSLVKIKIGDEVIETGRKKLGAILGDYVEVGCNSVLNPGTVIGQNSNIYPLSSVRGYVPENSIYKSKDAIVTKE